MPTCKPFLYSICIFNIVFCATTQRLIVLVQCPIKVATIHTSSVSQRVKFCFSWLLYMHLLSLISFSNYSTVHLHFAFIFCRCLLKGNMRKITRQKKLRENRKKEMQPKQYQLLKAGPAGTLAGWDWSKCWSRALVTIYPSHNVTLPDFIY